jgi:hypothetical protein
LIAIIVKEHEMLTELERIGFTYDLEYRDAEGRLVDVTRVHNLMPTEGVHYMLAASFAQGTQWMAFYIGLFSGDYTPYAQQTMSDFPMNATEFVGYDGTARLDCNFATPANQQVSNMANPAVFTITASGTVKGCFLATSAPKGSTGGILVSAVRRPSPLDVLPGGTLTVKAGIVVSSL